MKKIITLSCIILFLIKFSLFNAQNWTNTQILEANTAKDIEYLTKVEKECVMYINLCRLYPKEFLKHELLNYYGPKKYRDYLKDSKYRKSLINLLNTMKPINALFFDIEAYNNAKCFAKELGEAGIRGHTRINCIKGNYAECCSYGMHTSKDIVMQLLIDHNVPSLGHRMICLNKKYTKIGVSVHPHIKSDVCAVIDIIW